MDYLLGVSEVAQAIIEGRACRLSSQFALHLTETMLAIYEAGDTNRTILIRSTMLPGVYEVAQGLGTTNPT